MLKLTLWIQHINRQLSRNRYVNQVIFVFKILFTLTIFGFILWKADWQTIWSSTKDANAFLMLASFVVVILMVTVSALKWKLFLYIHHTQLDFNKLHKYYFIASFFNNFLPTSIGGDAYRVYKTMYYTRAKWHAAVAVLMERIIGVLMLLLIGLMGSFTGFLWAPDEFSQDVIFIGIVGLSITTLLFYLVLHMKSFKWIVKNIRMPWLADNIVEVRDDYQRQPLKTIQAITVSFLFHIMSILRFILIIKAVGGTISVYHLAVVVTFSTVVGMLPISINGMGLTDGSFVYLAVRFGMDYEHALMIMLLTRAFVIPISLFGGLLYFRESRSTHIPDVSHKGFQEHLPGNIR